MAFPFERPRSNNCLRPLCQGSDGTVGPSLNLGSMSLCAFSADGSIDSPSWLKPYVRVLSMQVYQQGS